MSHSVTPNGTDSVTDVVTDAVRSASPRAGVPTHTQGDFTSLVTHPSVETGSLTSSTSVPGVCPTHHEPWVIPDAPDGFRRCAFYVPELGACEDYGCPQVTR